MTDSLRHIAHFDLDSFFVSVEILNNPKLKGKPIIVGGTKDRGVVATCSYEARKFGVHSAMPMRTAMKLCPDAILLQGTKGQYSHYSRIVTEIISEKVPLFEKASIDEFYVDFTGMDKFFGVSKYAQELRKEIIKKTGLPISCGLSSGKMVSKIATNEAKPNGFLEIPHGKEISFLGPLSVEKIPGVGEQTEKILRKMNLNTIDDIANSTSKILENKLGKWGKMIWQKANGIDNSEIITDWEQKSISHENTFEQNQTDLDFLIRELVRLTEKAAKGLREEEKLAGCITLKIRYSDFETLTKQEVIDYTALDNELLEKVKNIFSKHIQKNRPVRLLGVKYSRLIPFTLQMNIFDDRIEKLQLYKAVDAIKNKYGDKMMKKQ
ncbi:MAG: DNA polymerase IV [Chitinophagaceae bacterium]|nr:MAG: DNA polymerase IV [Chitinophagaceae bacterium]